MRRNAVPWASAVLYEAEPVIEGRLGPEFLPAGGQLYPSGPDEYGTGGFSAVFPCRQDGLVMKVTLDGTEAFLCEAMLKIGLLPGLPDYQSEPLKIVRDGEPAWIVWRHDLPPPHLAREGERRSTEVRQRYTSERLWGTKTRPARDEVWDAFAKAENAAGLDDLRDLKEAQQAGMAITSLFSKTHASGTGVADAQRILAKRLSWAQQVFDPYYAGGTAGWRFMRGSDRDISTGDSAALHLLGYEMLLGRLAVGTLVPEMAQSLLGLLAQGVIVCDVQPDNVSAGVSPYTLFDGGFTLPLDPKWNPLWDHVGPFIERWWDHKRRMDGYGVWMGRPKGWWGA